MGRRGTREINRISVFPVPDGDTGTNFSLTLRAVADALRALGDASLPASDSDSDSMAPAAMFDVAVERDLQFCTEVLVRGDRLPPANQVRAAMHTFGGCTVVALTGDILKIHVHTATPDAVFSYAARWGRVDTAKAQDMRAQHRRTWPLDEGDARKG